jgi:ADP-ribose pyrophosphatase
MEAGHWEHLKTYWSSPGFSNEEIHVFLATGLSQVEKPEVDEDERIELVEWPLSDLDGLIDACTDGKTLVGLLELRRRRTAG